MIIFAVKFFGFFTRVECACTSYLRRFRYLGPYFCVTEIQERCFKKNGYKQVEYGRKKK